MSDDQQQNTQTEEVSAPVATPEIETTPVSAEKSVGGWPTVRSGMQVKVHQRIKDVNPKGEERERTQIFEGMVLKRHGGNTAGATITVRKQSFGIWVEKIFPVHLPEIINIEIIKTYRTRRANLAYLRNPKAKKLKELKKKK